MWSISSSEENEKPKTHYFVDDNIVDKPKTFASISGLDKITSNRESLDGLLNIYWGMSSLKAKQLLLEREGVSLDNVKDERWTFSGGTIAGYDVFNWMLYFNNDQFYEARVGINVALDAQAITKYKEVKTLLSKKYGTPDVIIENYSYPYEAGDGHEETAIKLGKAKIGADWKTNKTTISLQILTTLDIMLLYQANELSKEAKKNNEKKKLNEF